MFLVAKNIENYLKYEVEIFTLSKYFPHLVEGKLFIVHLNLVL